MKDDQGVYYIVHADDVVDTENKLGWFDTSFIKVHTDLLPEDYGFLHPDYGIYPKMNDDGNSTGFSEIRFGNKYPIVFEKRVKVKGKRFKRIEVEPEDAEAYFAKPLEDYQKYLEEYKARKKESKYVVAATVRWDYSQAGVRRAMYNELSVGRIDGAYYYSPGISERRKRVSAKSFKILCEITGDKQDQAKAIIKKIETAKRDLEYLDWLDWRAKDVLSEKQTMTDLKIRLRDLIQGVLGDFTQKERIEAQNNYDKLMTELRQLGTEPTEVDEAEEEPGH